MGWNNIIRGRVWKFGSDIDTDQILPGYAMAFPVERLKDYVLAGSGIPDFAQKVQPGDIIIADENFGCGSSREQAPVALKEAGVSMILASSFARIFRRNAINIGLPVMTSESINQLTDGMEIEVNLVTAELTLLDSGEKLSCQQLSRNVLETLEAGGLIEKVRRQVKLS